MAIRKTVRRDALKRKIQKGLYEARCAFHYTDDYYGDAQDNFGKTDWRPAIFSEEGSRTQSNAIAFKAWDFRTSTGYAAMEDDGTIAFAIHSNLVYKLRPRSAV